MAGALFVVLAVFEIVSWMRGTAEHSSAPARGT
jgi:hypothetical protein